MTIINHFSKIFQNLAFTVLAVLLLSSNIVASANSGYGTLPLKSKVGQTSNGFSVKDPYECGVGFFGEIEGGTRPYQVVLELYSTSNPNTLAYTLNNVQFTSDLKWNLPTPASVATGKYSVTVRVTDLTGATASSTFKANIKKSSECTILENPIVRNPVGTIRTGAKDVLDSNLSLVIISILAISIIAGLSLRMSKTKQIQR
jgi:hypothetical protein